MSVPLLSVEHLSLEFRTRSGVVRALEDINLEVFKGETVGVVGESGSGKSVTAYTVMGLLDAAAAITHGRALALRISEKQVSRLIDREELPRTRIGRSVRVPEAAVRRFIAQHTQPAPVPTTTPAA